MYNPYITLGELRTRPTYSSLAPTNGMPHKYFCLIHTDEFSDRFSSLSPDFRPYNPYKPKQGEWKTALEKSQHPTKLSASAVCVTGPPEVPLPPTMRRTFSVPIDPPRHENFSSYWGGRAKGLDYSGEFVHKHNLFRAVSL